MPPISDINCVEVWVATMHKHGLHCWPVFVGGYICNVRHEATQYTPNYLMLGREVRAPIDVVYGFPEASLPSTYDNYADELQQRMLRAYTLVYDSLKDAAKRAKRYYDLRVRPQRFAVGQWVYYYNPRKLPGRQDKWRRKYTGPLLVVGVPGPVTLKLQRSRRAAPFYVHLDKVEPYVADELPKSWLEEPTDSRAEAVPTLASSPSEESTLEPTSTDQAILDAAIPGMSPAQEIRSPRPKRERRLPRRFL